MIKEAALIGVAALVGYYVLKTPEGEGFAGGAGGEAVEKKEPGEAEDTVFITTTEKAVAVSGKKEVTAPASEWESLIGTIGQYTPPTKTSLAMGAYERMSGAFKVLGPTHPGSTYYATMGGPEITTLPSGAQTYKKGGSTILVPGTWEKKWMAAHRERVKVGQKKFYASQAKTA